MKRLQKSSQLHLRGEKSGTQFKRNKECQNQFFLSYFTASIITGVRNSAILFKKWLLKHQALLAKKAIILLQEFLAMKDIKTFQDLTAIKNPGNKTIAFLSIEVIFNSTKQGPNLLPPTLTQAWLDFTRWSFFQADGTSCLPDSAIMEQKETFGQQTHRLIQQRSLEGRPDQQPLITVDGLLLHLNTSNLSFLLLKETHPSNDNHTLRHHPEKQP